MQLVLAVQNYEMAHGVYPAGTMNKTGPILSRPRDYHHSWITQILPFLDHKSASRHVDFRVGVYHANNLPVRSLDLKVLKCPSVPVAGPGYSDYAGVHNDAEAPIDVRARRRAS